MTPSAMKVQGQMEYLMTTPEADKFKAEVMEFAEALKNGTQVTGLPGNLETPF
jgi:hypothetical protein